MGGGRLTLTLKLVKTLLTQFIRKICSVRRKVANFDEFWRGPPSVADHRIHESPFLGNAFHSIY